MRAEVYDGNAKKEEVLRLRLIKDSDSDVILVAVDEGGEPLLGGQLLLFNHNTKKFTKLWHINKEIPLILDSKGSVMID